MNSIWVKCPTCGELVLESEAERLITHNCYERPKRTTKKTRKNAARKKKA